MRTIFETETKIYRIVEKADPNYDLADLKGDSYSIEANPDLSPEQIKKEEREFEALVETEGVYGYILERWNATPGVGYEVLDSCWGFVGKYDENDEKFNHDIVEQFKKDIQDRIDTIPLFL